MMVFTNSIHVKSLVRSGYHVLDELKASVDISVIRTHPVPRAMLF